ncbi:hypothetical protein Cadr_000022897 [Camelus dromedarius]|uniref:Uncharacterized protein n=1 Tax=Camelus dromedarius TaxID=9838 RepID=A0A5N4CH19_CAMDR|nr:hypothetical protein Cadr_000022897 [Camelus dromedarius]
MGLLGSKSPGPRGPEPGQVGTEQQAKDTLAFRVPSPAGSGWGNSLWPQQWDRRYPMPGPGYLVNREHSAWYTVGVRVHLWNWAESSCDPGPA